METQRPCWPMWSVPSNQCTLWELKAEIACETSNPGSSGQKPNNKADPKPNPILATTHHSPRTTLAQQETKKYFEQKEPTSDLSPKLGKTAN